MIVHSDQAFERLLGKMRQLREQSMKEMPSRPVTDSERTFADALRLLIELAQDAAVISGSQGRWINDIRKRLDEIGSSDEIRKRVLAGETVSFDWRKSEQSLSEKEYSIPVSLLRKLFLPLGRAENNPTIWAADVLQRLRELQTYVEERYSTAFEEWT